MIINRLPSIYFYPQNCVDQNIRFSDTSSGSTFDTTIHIEKHHLTLIKRSKTKDKLTGNYRAARQSKRHTARVDRKAPRTLRTLARILFTLIRVQLTKARILFYQARVQLTKARILFHQGRVQLTKARILFHQDRVQFDVFSVLYTLDLVLFHYRAALLTPFCFPKGINRGALNAINKYSQSRSLINQF